jgi:hypothetical protein
VLQNSGSALKEVCSDGVSSPSFLSRSRLSSSIKTKTVGTKENEGPSNKQKRPRFDSVYSSKEKGAPLLAPGLNSNNDGSCAKARGRSRTSSTIKHHTRSQSEEGQKSRLSKGEKSHHSKHESQKACHPETQLATQRVPDKQVT